MPIQKIKSARINTTEVTDFVATDGMIFFDEANGFLRIGDGVTPGGRLIYPVRSAIVEVKLPIQDKNFTIPPFVHNLKVIANARVVREDLVEVLPVINIAPDCTVTIDSNVDLAGHWLLLYGI